MSRMTLTEFLLARIAEDEERAKYVSPHYDDCEHFHYFSEGGLPCTCGLEDKLLAECEAKRRIVNRLLLVQEGDTTEHAWHEQGLFEAVGFLAQPYADHPNFDPAWRV